MPEIESSMEYSGVWAYVREVCVCVRVTQRQSTENSLAWKGKIEAFEGQPRSVCLCVNFGKAPEDCVVFIATK